MRTLILSLSLAALAAVGLTASPQARASDLRVYVDLGDIVFDYGRPYYRHGYVPLYVETIRYGPPRYYYHPRPVRHYHYAPPGHYVRHYAPPPRHHGKYHHRKHHWDRHDGRYRDRDRRHRDRRYWD